MIAISEDVFERNRHLLGPDEDYWIGQRVSRGVKDVPGDNLDYHGPNVVVECMPLPFPPACAAVHRGHQGNGAVTPSHSTWKVHHYAACENVHNYLNLIVANQETPVRAIRSVGVGKDSALDANGNLLRRASAIATSSSSGTAEIFTLTRKSMCCPWRVAADGNRSGARWKQG